MLLSLKVTHNHQYKQGVPSTAQLKGNFSLINSSKARARKKPNIRVLREVSSNFNTSEEAVTSLAHYTQLLSLEGEETPSENAINLDLSEDSICNTVYYKLFLLPFCTVILH
jgi:hypothetical protein